MAALAAAQNIAAGRDPKPLPAPAADDGTAETWLDKVKAALKNNLGKIAIGLVAVVAGWYLFFKK